MGRRDADGDDPPGAGDGHRLPDRVPELAARDRMTWSAANEPITASGSRRSMIAAARPMAGIESRGLGSATTSSGPRSGSCARTASACTWPVTTRTRPSVSGSQPVPGPLEQGPARAGEVVEELRRRPARQRPQPGAGSPAGMTAQNPSIARSAGSGAPSVMVPKASRLGGTEPPPPARIPLGNETNGTAPRPVRRPERRAEPGVDSAGGHLCRFAVTGDGPPHDDRDEARDGRVRRAVRPLRHRPHVRQPQGVRWSAGVRRLLRAPPQPRRADPAVLRVPLGPADPAHRRPRRARLLGVLPLEPRPGCPDDAGMR